MNNCSELDITTDSTGNDSLLDEDLLTKNLFLNQEIKSLKNALQDKEKELSELKRKFEDKELELNHQTEINDNQNELIKFYQNQGNSNNNKKNIINDLESELKKVKNKYEIKKTKINKKKKKKIK